MQQQKDKFLPSWQLSSDYLAI